MMEERDWETVCWDMVMECEPSDDPIEGFKAPSSELIHKYCILYPHFADDLVDFAATCRTEAFFLKKYPPTEPTEAEVKSAVERAMKAFRNALRREDRKRKVTP